MTLEHTPSLDVEVVVVGPIETNCYLVGAHEEVMIIDPGDEPQKIIDVVGGRKVTCIVLTHLHWDHKGAVPALQEVFDAPVFAHECDASGIFDGGANARWTDPACFEAHRLAVASHRQVDRALKDGDIIEVGGCAFRVLHTPGHSAGSMCLYCESEGLLFAGDTLFAHGSYGRTDFEGGSMEAMVETLATKFAHISDDVEIFSGHGPSSHFFAERKLNPYLR